MHKHRIAALAASTALALAAALAAATTAGAAPRAVHPDATAQLCETSGTNCMRDQNNGGGGSAVVEAACDCPGPAENVQLISGGGSGLVKIAFTGHSGQCVALGSDHSSFVLGNCSTADGTVMILTIVNGGQKFEDRYADQHRGGTWFLTGLGNDGLQLTIGRDGAGFQRWSNCTGSCF